MYLILLLSGENELKGLSAGARRMEPTSVVIHIIVGIDSVQTDLAVSILSMYGNKRNTSR